MDRMKDYKQLIKELPSKTVVMAFGRFNPPTTGHELLIKAVKKLAQQKNADHVIYASRTQDAKKNPLSVDKKVKYLRLMFKNTNFAAADTQVRTFIEAAKVLNKRYKNIVMVAGSDRVQEFKRLLNTYNGKEFKFDTIEVISAGERDPDADDATGMSASKMRAIAVKGNYAEFKKGLPSTVRDIDGKRLMNDIRDGMKLEPIKEQIVLVKDDLREQYFRGEIFNEGDLVESDGCQYTIVKRGSNHLLLREESGDLVSKWIQDVQPLEEEMNEELTTKTLKPNDKIKIARVISAMLGVDNVEASSNPENLINMGLRKVRSKALNPEAISILQRMLRTAASMDIKYDKSLLPSKLKEGVTQPNGTDRIEPMVNEPIVPMKRFKDHRKIGNTLHDDDGGIDDQVRKMKVKYKLGEDKEQKELAKANLAAKHAREKEALSVKHDNEKENMKEETNQLDEISAGLAGRYIQKATQYQVDKKGIRGALKDKTSKRAKGIDTAYDRVLKSEEVELEESQTDHWKRIQSMDKGSLLGGKDGARKKLAYLSAVHDYHKKYGNDTKKVKGDIERIRRSRLAEAVPKATGDLKDACWKGYTAVGMKTKNGKKVPNCVPVKEETLDELSTDLLSRYKKKASDQATAADKAGDFKKGDKRYSGIIKATKKQFANDLKEDVCPECNEDPCTCDGGHGYIQGKPFDPFFESAVDVSDYEENWEEHIFAKEDPSEDEIDHFINTMSDEDILDFYDEDELAVVDDETGEELPEDEEEKELDEEALMEVLSRGERMKAKFRIRRTKAKRQRATKIALKRYSNTATANKRARRLAVRMMKKRLLRGQDPRKVSVGEKERIERILHKRRDMIKRLSMKMVPRVRKIEKARMSHGSFTKGSTPSVGF